MKIMTQIFLNTNAPTISSLLNRFDHNHYYNNTNKSVKVLG